MKIVINECFGGFGLSKECVELMAEMGDEDAKEELNDKEFYGFWYGLRDDPILVAAVEKLGCEKASGHYAKLKIVEIPDGTNFTVEDYDGVEHIAEVHNTWS